MPREDVDYVLGEFIWQDGVITLQHAKKRRTQWRRTRAETELYFILMRVYVNQIIIYSDFLKSLLSGCSLQNFNLKCFKL